MNEQPQLTVERQEHATEAGVPEAIRRAQEAFRRDLESLLADRKTRGKYVVYWADKRVAVGKDYRSVIAEVVRLDIPEHEYIVDKVLPGAGRFEDEEIEHRGFDVEPA